MEKKTKNTQWLLICVIFSLLFACICLPWLAGRPSPTKHQRIDATVDKWMWGVGIDSNHFLVMHLWYENNNYFPGESKMRELIERTLKEREWPPEMFLDEWGNPVFYYNGREDGKCAWYASAGPDGIWFTGSKDPQTIVDRINEISVQTEFRYFTDSEYFRERNIVKYRRLIIGDDHIVLADMYIQFLYSRDNVEALYPIEIFEDAQEQVKRIGSYEEYHKLHNNQCIVHKFLEAAIEDNNNSINTITPTPPPKSPEIRNLGT